MGSGGVLAWTVWALMLHAVFTLVGAPPENHFNEGRRLYRQQRFQEAEASFRRAFEHAELGSAAYYNAGNAAFCRKDYARAIAYYESALSLAPRDEDVWHNLELTRRRLDGREAGKDGDDRTAGKTASGGERPDLSRPPSEGAESGREKVVPEALRKVQEAERERQEAFRPERTARSGDRLQDIFSLPPEQLAEVIREETRAGYPFRPGRSLRPSREPQRDVVDW